MIKIKLIGLITVLVVSPFFITAQNRNELIAWEVQGDTLLNHGDFDGAVKLFTKLIAKTKFTTANDYDLYYKRGIANFQMNAFEAALADADYYLDHTQDDQGTVLKVYVYEKMGKTDEAIGQLDSLRIKYPQSEELLQWKIQTLMHAERYAQARDVLKLAIAVTPDPKLRLLLGLSEYNLGDLKSALVTFDDLIKDDPTNLEAYLYPASLCLEDGLNEISLQYCDRGLTQAPSDPNLTFYKGVALYELGQLDESCRYLTRAFYAGVDDAAGYLKEYCYEVK